MPTAGSAVVGERSGFGLYLETGHWLHTAPGGGLTARALDLDVGVSTASRSGYRRRRSTAWGPS